MIRGPSTKYIHERNFLLTQPMKLLRCFDRLVCLNYQPVVQSSVGHATRAFDIHLLIPDRAQLLADD